MPNFQYQERFKILVFSLRYAHSHLGKKSDFLSFNYGSNSQFRSHLWSRNITFSHPFLRSQVHSYLMYSLENLSLMAYFVILSVCGSFYGVAIFLVVLVILETRLPATPVFIICRLIIPKLQYLIISKGLTKGFLCSYFKFCIIA